MKEVCYSQVHTTYLDTINVVKGRETSNKMKEERRLVSNQNNERKELTVVEAVRSK